MNIILLNFAVKNSSKYRSNIAVNLWQCVVYCKRLKELLIDWSGIYEKINRFL